MPEDENPAVDLLAEDIKISKGKGLFCGECRGLMKPKAYEGKSQEYKGRNIPYCPRCEKYYVISETIVIRMSSEKETEGIALVSDDDKITHPRKCDCGSETAYEIRIPPRWKDEDDLVIVKCTKCGVTYREGFSS